MGPPTMTFSMFFLFPIISRANNGGGDHTARRFWNSTFFPPEKVAKSARGPGVQRVFKSRTACAIGNDPPAGKLPTAPGWSRRSCHNRPSVEGNWRRNVHGPRDGDQFSAAATEVNERAGRIRGADASPEFLAGQRLRLRRGSCSFHPTTLSLAAHLVRHRDAVRRRVEHPAIWQIFPTPEISRTAA
ncbi:MULTISPECIES: hypothetical protein [unclassified Frankia]|uniref:hypothetical protein n=1 Tax=unclassified Frankia TaxID=2632575 RepID=UPI002AD54326|nr:MULTISPECIES: hypothetical protein [unclassified Frankia]